MRSLLVRRFPKALAASAACHPHTLLITPTHFVRTAIGTVISFHLPGLKSHRLNVTVLAASRVFNPADLIIVTRLTRPVFRSMSSRYRPSPLYRDQAAESPMFDRNLLGYCG